MSIILSKYNILNKDGAVNYYGKILSSEEANHCFDLLQILYINTLGGDGQGVLKRKIGYC